MCVALTTQLETLFLYFLYICNLPVHHSTYTPFTLSLYSTIIIPPKQYEQQSKIMISFDLLNFLFLFSSFCCCCSCLSTSRSSLDFRDGLCLLLSTKFYHALEMTTLLMIWTILLISLSRSLSTFPSKRAPCRHYYYRSPRFLSLGLLFLRYDDFTFYY